MLLSQFQGFSYTAEPTIKGQWGHTIMSAGHGLVSSGVGGSRA